ncbi:MAG: hypothetical protein LBG17_01520 [Bacteroidales bacterium]|jgi:hypothetical protein|nr:hypothetical protein [Bacteroidales bacterium]
MTSYIVIPQDTLISVLVPSEYIGKQILISMSLDVKPAIKKKSKQKLSEIIYGSLSEERVSDLQKELKQMRNEWTEIFIRYECNS